MCTTHNGDISTFVKCQFYPRALRWLLPPASSSATLSSANTELDEVPSIWKFCCCCCFTLLVENAPVGSYVHPTPMGVSTPGNLLAPGINNRGQIRHCYTQGVQMLRKTSLSLSIPPVCILCWISFSGRFPQVKMTTGSSGLTLAK